MEMGEIDGSHYIQGIVQFDAEQFLQTAIISA